MDNKTKGNLGEEITTKWLIKRGYLIIDRNVFVSWGEIDIICLKDKVLHFVEVKTSTKNSAMSGYENMHRSKYNKLRRAIGIWLNNNRGVADFENVQIDLAAVELDINKRLGHVEFIENIGF